MNQLRWVPISGGFWLEITMLTKNRNRKILIPFLLMTKVFVNMNLLNDDNLEMKNSFSHIYPNDMKEISDEENIFDFYERNLSFDGKRYEVKLLLKTNYESLPIIIV